MRTHPDAVAAVHGDRQWTYRRAERPRQPAGAGAAGARAAPRGRRRGGDRAQPGLDGRRARGLQGRRGVPADRAALPGRPDRDHAVPGRVPARADRARQHRHARQGPRLAARRPDAVHRRRPTREGHADGDLGVAGRGRTSSPTSTSPPAPPASPRARCASTRACSTTSTPRSTTWGSAQGQVVAQTAPQCFDISLWQLVSALLVGGRTLLVEQEVILDVERFVDTIVAGRVDVLQVVPSYLEVVLSYLEQHPRELPDLRCVSVTGEALKKELVQRWFAAEPGIRLVNAYGLTETSDDTNHEVMDRVPDGDRVPLGPADQQRARLRRRRAPARRCRWVRPARSSSPGSASAAGTSTTRSAPGGLHDRPAPAGRAAVPGRRLRPLAARTASWSSSAAGTARSRSAASGSRSARSRTRCCGCPASATARWWSPSGPTSGKHLVAFYSGAAAARGRACCGTGWARRCPRTWSRRRSTGGTSLPLTANGKIDRKALTALAAELEAADGRDDSARRARPTERRLAAAWAKVLGIPAGPDRPAATTSSTGAARRCRR